MPLTGKADALAVVDPGRYLDLQLAPVDHASRAVARLARMLDDLATAAALRARLRAHELPEDPARDLLKAARPLAAGASRHAGARLDAVAAAGGARDGHIERHANRDAGRCVDELDLHLGRDIGTALTRRASRSPEDVVAEERAEQIAEAADVEVRRRESARAKTLMTVAVVERARLGVRQHLVRLGHLAEPHLGLGLVETSGCN